MTIHATMPAHNTASYCAKTAKDFCFITGITAVEFEFNGIKCTVFWDTNPEQFEEAVEIAQKTGKTHVIGTESI